MAAENRFYIEDIWPSVIEILYAVSKQASLFAKTIL